LGLGRRFRFCGGTSRTRLIIISGAPSKVAIKVCVLFIIYSEFRDAGKPPNEAVEKYKTQFAFLFWRSIFFRVSNEAVEKYKTQFAFLFWRSIFFRVSFC
jgi:hypothetical protein